MAAFLALRKPMMRYAPLGLMTAILCAFGFGCTGSEPATKQSAPFQPPPVPPDTAVRIHWLGKNRMGIEASAYYFLRVWSNPDSTKIEAQTIYKLSTLPWRMLQGEDQATNAYSS